MHLHVKPAILELLPPTLNIGRIQGSSLLAAFNINVGMPNAFLFLFYLSNCPLATSAGHFTFKYAFKRIAIFSMRFFDQPFIHLNISCNRSDLTTLVVTQCCISLSNASVIGDMGATEERQRGVRVSIKYVRLHTRKTSRLQKEEEEEYLGIKTNGLFPSTSDSNK